MKFNKYSWLAALPMIFTACQEDALVKEQQQDKIYTISATMDGGAASRAQIVIGNDAEAVAGETFMWNTGDSFDMYQDLGDGFKKVTTFNISQIGEDANTATFNAEKGAYAGKPFKAFYPANSVNDGHFGRKLTSSLTFGENNHADVWATYFKENMLMMVTGESLNGENPSLSFEHLCALVRISYTNETGVEQNISGFHLSDDVMDVDFGNGYGYNISEGKGFVGVYGQLAPLSTQGLKVSAGETKDLYLLLFPTGFEEYPEGKLGINIEHGEGEVKSIYLPFQDIIEQDENDKVFGAGYRYWFNVTESPVGLTWTKKSVEVDKLEDFRIAMENEKVADIILKNPIVIDAETNINTSGSKRISMSHDFKWNVGETEYDALIVNDNSNRLEFSNCIINGASEDSSKYLLETNSGEIWTGNFVLNASGNMNALKVKNSTFYMYFSSSSISVENENAFSVYAEATDAHFDVELLLDENSGRTIEGNVKLVSNYYDEAGGSSRFIIENCTLNGDILTEGSEQERLEVTINEGAVYNGNKIAKVGSIVEMLNFKKNNAITELKLTNPILITGEESISLYFSKDKTISMDESFTWFVGEIEYDALIVNDNSNRLEFSNCIINGVSEDSSKYLLETNSGVIWTGNFVLNASGSMNGLKVKNSTFYMYFSSSSISVENEHAFSVYAEATDAHFDVELLLDENSGRTIEGNVKLVSNYYDEAGGSSRFIIENCILNGDILTEGSEQERLEVTINEGAVYNGNKIAKVGSIVEMLNFKKNNAITELKLTNPILITGEEIVYLDFSKDKTISMDESFTWFVGEIEYDALIVNDDNNRVVFSNCIINGASEDSSKYLLETNSGEIWTGNFVLNASGSMNGLKVKNSTFYMYYSSSSISVENENAFSVYAEATDAHFDVELLLDENSGRTIKGNVKLVSNYYNEAGGSSRFIIENCTLNGDILKEGNKQEYLYISTEESVV